MNRFICLKQPEYLTATLDQLATAGTDEGVGVCVFMFSLANQQLVHEVNISPPFSTQKEKHSSLQWMTAAPQGSPEEAFGRNILESSDRAQDLSGRLLYSKQVHWKNLDCDLCRRNSTHHQRQSFE